MKTPQGLRAVFQAPAGFQEGIITHPNGHHIRGGALERHTTPQARVLIGPGLSEPMEKYFELMHELDALGCNLYAINWRDQGGSDPYLPDAPDLRHATDLGMEVDDLIHVRKTLIGPQPAFYLGHSFGGLIGLLAQQRHSHAFSGIIANTPLVGMKHPAIRLLGERLISHLPLPGKIRESAVHANRTWVPRDNAENTERTEGFSSDPERSALHDAWLRANPEWQKRSITFGWVQAVCRGIQSLIHPGSARIDADTLIVTAGDDILIDNSNIAILRDRVLNPAFAHTCLHLPRAKHEVFMEAAPVRGTAMRFVHEFIGVRPPRP